MKLIKELLEGDRLIFQAIVGNVTKGVNATGTPYLNVELRDSSGQIAGKKWELTSDDNDIFVVGNIVEISGEVIKYRENLQIKVLGAKLLNSDEIDVTRFIKAPPIPKEELVKRFNKIKDSIKNEDCSKLLNHVLNKYKDVFYDAPAASSVHHEFSSGLLMHSTCIAEICDYLASFYHDVDRDLLITGAILHDFGKMVELVGPAVYHYSVEGKLLGHISIGCAEIRKAAEDLKITSEVPVLLEHMILSHHGQYEFGSPVLPLTREALILSMIDNLDSKMLILDKAYEEVKPGEFTQKIFPLDGRSFYKKK